jgi:hypothetical protein
MVINQQGKVRASWPGLVCRSTRISERNSCCCWAAGTLAGQSARTVFKVGGGAINGSLLCVRHAIDTAIDTASEVWMVALSRRSTLEAVHSKSGGLTKEQRPFLKRSGPHIVIITPSSFPGCNRHRVAPKMELLQARVANVLSNLSEPGSARARNLVVAETQCGEVPARQAPSSAGEYVSVGRGGGAGSSSNNSQGAVREAAVSIHGERLYHGEHLHQFTLETFRKGGAAR